MARHAARPENWNLTVGASHRVDRLTITGDVFYNDIRNRLLSGAIGTSSHRSTPCG